MTTKEMLRCKKCSCCVEDSDGCWICADCGENIQDIPDEECPLEQDW